MMASLTSSTVLLTIIIISLHESTPVVSQTSSNSTAPVCKGTNVFNLYFILDSSGSVSNNFASSIVPFVMSVIDRYAKSEFGIAIVTFDSASKIQLQLTPTTDTNAVHTALNRLKNVAVGGNTVLSPALTKVNSMINLSGNDATNIILIVTDGHLSDKLEAERQARIVRGGGSTILAIGVGSSISNQQLVNLTGYRDQVFTAMNFGSLNQLLDKVVKEICFITTSDKHTTNTGAIVGVIVGLLILATGSHCIMHFMVSISTHHWGYCW